MTYTIDDPITAPLATAVEVTIDLGNGQKRCCFFATPQLLASIGDFVDGTHVRVHPGVSHMIVVSEINEAIIDKVLRRLAAEGQLEAHSLPLI
jgi:hypothetical protein